MSSRLGLLNTPHGSSPDSHRDSVRKYDSAGKGICVCMWVGRAGLGGKRALVCACGWGGRAGRGGAGAWGSDTAELLNALKLERVHAAACP